MKKIVYILVPFLFLSSFLFRETSAAELVKRINQYFRERPMERIFLHLDKPYYASGDDMWYAGYVLNYNSNTTSDLSEILHVELFNKEGKSILHQKSRLSSGFANGVIELPDTLSPDYYLLKGYTNWSRNFAEGLLFSHYVKIVSSTFTPPDIDTSINHVDFYPEGGNIIVGKLNQVAFKADQEARGYAHLINAINDTLDEVRYDENGFGVLRLVPQSKGDQFYLVFEDIKNRFALPEANESGSVLRLLEDNRSFRLLIDNSNDLTARPFTILILYNGNIMSVQEGSFGSVGTVLRLTKDKLPEGLHHILVIDEDLNVRNQRVFYNEPVERKKSIISVETSSTYEIGEEVKLKLSNTGDAGTHVSVSVTPKKYFGDALRPTIEYDRQQKLSDGDHFSHNDFLMTEKIGTYSIEHILKSGLPEFDYLIEKNGLFQITIQQEEADNSYYSLSLKNEDSIDFYFNKGANGKNVSFTFPSFYGSKEVIIKRHKWSAKSQGSQFTLDNSFHISPFQKKFTQSASETSYARYAKENQLINRLYGVTIKKQIDNLEVPPSFSILRVPDESIRLKDYISLPDMTTICKELIPGVRISEKPEGSYRIHMRSIDSETGYYQPFLDNEPLRFIDGLPIYDSKYIAELDPLEVKKLNMSYGRRTLNGVSFDGILSVETEEGNYGKMNNLGQMMFDFSGYADNYIHNQVRPGRNIPDFRSTYYWNPSVYLSSKPITLSFPTSDEPGTYMVDIQGVNEKGQTIAERHHFEVKGRTTKN